MSKRKRDSDDDEEEAERKNKRNKIGHLLGFTGFTGNLPNLQLCMHLGALQVPDKLYRWGVPWSNRIDAGWSQTVSFRPNEHSILTALPIARKKWNSQLEIPVPKDVCGIITDYLVDIFDVVRVMQGQSFTLLVHKPNSFGFSVYGDVTGDPDPEKRVREAACICRSQRLPCEYKLVSLTCE